MYVYFANGFPELSTNVSMDSDMCFLSFADLFLVCVFSLPGHALKSRFPQ